MIQKARKLMISHSLYAALLMIATPALSGPRPPSPSPVPTPSQNRTVCLNLLCNYEGENQKCQAAAQLEKFVSLRGDEVEDRSEHPFHPEFEVACNDSLIYNGIGYRFTDALGTRIQAQSGPYPAILLPRGVLRDGHRYLISSLELGDENLRGYCYIYTGPR